MIMGRQTDTWTDKQTLVIVESLSRLKILNGVKWLLFLKGIRSNISLIRSWKNLLKHSFPGTIHHQAKLFIINLSITINICFLKYRICLNCFFSSKISFPLTSTRLTHSSSVIFSPRFIMTCFNSDLEMYPLPSWH